VNRQNNTAIVRFIRRLIRNRGINANILAAEIAVSHATVSRWLSGYDVPSPQSCRKLARYSGKPVTKVMALAKYLPGPVPEQVPDFREYAQLRYGHELDEDIIAMIEDLIARGLKKASPGE